MNWYKKAQLVRDLLPNDATDIVEHENGRSARAKSKCPNCGVVCSVAVCSDVGGIWWYCPKCGLVD